MDLFKKVAVKLASNDATPDARYTTRCRKCGWFLKSPPFTPVLNGGVDPVLFEFIGKLKSHIESKHQDVGMEIGAFSAFLIAAAFKFEDPYLLKMRSDLRYTLHKSTRVVRVTDEQIAERLAHIQGLTPDQIEGLNILLKDLRDVLTESGQYAPKESAQSPLVAV